MRSTIALPLCFRSIIACCCCFPYGLSYSRIYPLDIPPPCQMLTIHCIWTYCFGHIIFGSVPCSYSFRHTLWLSFFTPVESAYVVNAFTHSVALTCFPIRHDSPRPSAASLRPDNPLDLVTATPTVSRSVPQAPTIVLDTNPFAQPGIPSQLSSHFFAPPVDVRNLRHNCHTPKTKASMKRRRQTSSTPLLASPTISTTVSTLVRSPADSPISSPPSADRRRRSSIKTPTPVRPGNKPLYTFTAIKPQPHKHPHFLSDPTSSVEAPKHPPKNPDGRLPDANDSKDDDGDDASIVSVLSRPMTPHEVRKNSVQEGPSQWVKVNGKWRRLTQYEIHGSKPFPTDPIDICMYFC